MDSPPVLPDEAERIRVLHDYDILDSEAEQEFDDLVRLASQICSSPISLITLIDKDRAWYKAKKGVTVTETERDLAFCSYAIANPGLFQISDTTADVRFSHNPLVTGHPHIKFYAGVPLVTRQGHQLGTLCVLDIKSKALSHEQRFALETLAAQAMKLIEARAQNHALQHITEVQDRLLSIVSHDVRNPLASLQGILGLWTAKLISETEADDMLGVAAQQLDSTLDMITNVLQWGKLAAKTSTEEKVFNLRELAQRCCASKQDAMATKGNSFINEIPAALVVNGNEKLFQFILKNLLGNGCKFTANGSVILQARKASDRVEITIRDTGTGMSAERITQLFDGKKNYPLPGTANETGGGLSLMLIGDLLNKYKGTIKVTSREQEGCTVVITL